MAGGKLISTGVEFPDATTQTTSGLPLTGGTMTGDVSLGDGVKATFGASDDLQIYHDGSNSYVDEQGTGILKLRGSAGIALEKYDSTEQMLTAYHDDAVTLFHNGSSKLATTATGVDVTGSVTCDGFTSTGIDDNATSTAITIDASENVTFTGTLNGISTTKSASGNRWGVLPAVESNGVMEVGRYIDFHETDADTSDYGARLELSGTQLISTHGIYAAAGVYLGGTAAANALDDYEEGTFTPYLHRSGGAVSATYTSQSGTYTKVGRLVTYYINITTSAIASQGSGYTLVGGMPYNCAALAYVSSGNTTANAFGSNIITVNYPSSNLCYFGNGTTSTGFPPVQAAWTSGTLRMSGTYYTT